MMPKRSATRSSTMHLFGAACLLATAATAPALAQNLPGQGSARPSATNIRNYTLKNQSGQVITDAEARFSNGESKSVAPGSGIEPSEGQSFGEDQRACLTRIDVTLKDGSKLALAHPGNCRLAVVIVEPKAIVVNSSASLKPAMSN